VSRKDRRDVEQFDLRCALVDRLRALSGAPHAALPRAAGLIVAFIRYVPPDELLPGEHVDDKDHIIQIHSVHPAVMRQHVELYRELMHRRGPLSRREREIIAVRVSGLNHCPY